SRANPPARTPCRAASSSATSRAVLPSRPVSTTSAAAAANASAVASPMPRVPPVTTATRPARPAEPTGAGSVTDAHPPQHVGRHLEAAHVDDLFRVELDAELVLDGRHERHVAERVPGLEIAVLQLLDVDVVAQFEGVAEDLAEPVVDRHDH